MKAVGITSTGEPVEYGTVGEWELISAYQDGTFLMSMFDTYDAVDKYINGSYLKISCVDEKINEAFLPEEYIDIVVDQLELLRPEIVIHRITGDPKIDDLVEPTWLVKKFCVLNDIDKEMAKRNTYQGINSNDNI